MVEFEWVGDGTPPDISGIRPTAIPAVAPSETEADDTEFPARAILIDPTALLNKPLLDERLGHDPLVPVIALSPNPSKSLIHVDLWADPDDSKLADRAEATARAILSRLDLGVRTTAARSAHFAALAFAYTRRTDIRPHYDPNTPRVCAYPALPGHPDLGAALRDLSAAGLLTAEPVDTLPQCPDCGSARTLAREVCVGCGRAILDEMPIVHHYRCGYQGPESDFLEGGGSGHICPKCQRELRHFGRDHDRSGILYVCRSCGTHMSEPEPGFACVDCGAQTPGDRMTFRRLEAYRISPAAGIALSLMRDGQAGSMMESLTRTVVPDARAPDEAPPIAEGPGVYAVDLSYPAPFEPTDLTDAYSTAFEALRRHYGKHRGIRAELRDGETVLLVPKRRDADSSADATEEIREIATEAFPNESCPEVRVAFEPLTVVRQMEADG